MVFDTIKQAIRALEKHPVLALPIVLNWFLFAGVLLSLEWGYLPVSIPMVFAAVVLFAVSLTFSGLWVLKMIEQLEQGGTIRLGDSFGGALRSMPSALPIALIWAVVWFFLLVLKALTSRKGKSRSSPSVESAARTLNGMNSPFNLMRLGISMAERVIRMYVFLTLPAIAWDGKGFRQAFSRSFKILTTHPKMFLSAYTGVLAIMFLIGIPIALVSYGAEMVTYPQWVWTAMIIYAWMVWSFSIYLEQVSTGLLYLWNRTWERSGKAKITDVPPPDLLDDEYLLKEGA